MYLNNHPSTASKLFDGIFYKFEREWIFNGFHIPNYGGLTRETKDAISRMSPVGLVCLPKKMGLPSEAVGSSTLLSIDWEIVRHILQMTKYPGLNNSQTKMQLNQIHLTFQYVPGGCYVKIKFSS